MQENKPSGVDGISHKILKETVEQISTPHAHVFNMSLQEGIVLSECKEANIIPLFKKVSRNKSVNYRPVSLTSVICKVLETFIRDYDGLSHKTKINKPFSAWVPKSKIMPNKFVIFFEEITKWVDDWSPVEHLIKFHIND